MTINAISQTQFTPTTHAINNAPVRERHPHLSIEGVTQQPSEELLAARAFQTAVRGFGTAMHNAATEILNSTQSLFDSLVGTSSDETAVNVAVNSYTNGNGRNGAAAYTNGDSNTYEATIQVSQLATAQQNTGTPLPTNEVTQANQGTNNFTVSRNGNQYDLSVTINETTSNRTAQQRVANAINDESIGIRAETVTNGENQSALVLTAINTGENNAFSINDTDGGNIIETLGANDVTQVAQDAFYTVNGESYTASTNTIDLSQGISATLQTTTDMPVTATTERDVAGIAHAINDLVQNFNDMRDAAVEYAETDPNADTLRHRLDNIYYDNTFALEVIGVTHEDHQLQVDNEQLFIAIEDGHAEQQLADPFGFTGQLSRLGEALTEDPTNYALNLNMAVL